MNEVRRGTVISFDATTWQAQILLDGADVDATIPVGQWVQSTQLTVDAKVAVLVWGETNSSDGIVLGAYGAAAGSSFDYPALTALTTGQPLRATSATAAAFGALDLTNANAVSGALPINRGGLNLSAAPTNGQVPIGNGTTYVLATLTGTTNQVAVANGAGTITLSTPQNIDTAAAVTFGSLNLGSVSGAATGQVKLSDKIYPGGAEWIKNYDLGIINNAAVAALMSDNLAANGVAMVRNNSGAYHALFSLGGFRHVVTLMSDPDAQFTVTAGTNAKTNVYWSAGNSRYEIENKTGTNNFYDLFYFGG